MRSGCCSHSGTVYPADMIEEYGRHTGHADLIREAVDGRTGEDPPADWPAWVAREKD